MKRGAICFFHLSLLFGLDIEFFEAIHASLESGKESIKINKKERLRWRVLKDALFSSLGKNSDDHIDGDDDDDDDDDDNEFPCQLVCK